MRAPLLCLIATSFIAVPAAAFAQSKPKTPTGPETRYFTSIEGLMDGNADVVLRETRQGKSVTAATLDICFQPDKTSDRRDRFVANLAVNGATLTGTAQTQLARLPVSVKLNRKPSGDNFDFKGQITIGQTTTEVASTDNSDMSEEEFKETQAADDSVVAAPKDFTEASPESVAVRLKLDAVTDFVKSLRGQNVELSMTGLVPACDALRSGEQTVTLAVDPDRAPAVIAHARTMAGVVAAGWTTGLVETERSLRLAAADWRSGERTDRDKLAAAVSGVIEKALGATIAGTTWDENTGQAKLRFRRPNADLPALNLTDTLEFPMLVSPDKPGGTERVMLWLGSPTITTTDEGAGNKLKLAQATAGDEEGEVQEDGGAFAAVARELKGQRWDADANAWK